MMKTQTENTQRETGEGDAPRVPEQSADNMSDQTDAYWNENTLVSISDFRDIGYDVRKNYFERCALDNDEASYFCAVNGECFALIHRGNGSCIAEVEKALSLACNGYRYVTFALKNRTPSASVNLRCKRERLIP